MPTFETRIQPQGKVLQDYWDCEKTVQIIRGPLGSSKTITTCLKIIETIRKQKPDANGVRRSRWLAARNTYGELFTTTIQDWLATCGHLGDFNQGGAKPPCHYLNFALEDGTTIEAEIWFISFDRPIHVKKAKGLQLTGVWLNEASELPRAAIDMLDLRHGRYPSKKEGVECSWHGMLGDTNSFDDDHWLYKIFEEETPEDWSCFSQPGGVIRDKDDNWIENPDAENLSNLPKDYYKRGMQGKADKWIRLMLANEYAFYSDGLPVHERYNDDIHCVDLGKDWKPSKHFPIILGMDAGRTPAVAFLQETSTGGVICFDEFTTEDGGSISATTFAPELSRYISKTYPDNEFKGFCDPSADYGGQATDDTPIKIMKANGVPMVASEKSNDVLIRRSALELPLIELDMAGNPRFILSTKCKTIRKGLAGGWCYDKVAIGGEERYHNKPNKGKFSHVCEAVEYGLVGMGEGRNVIKANRKDKYEDWNTSIN